MAICYAHQTVIYAASGSSAAGLAAYITRSALEDRVTGTSYDFTGHADDLAHTELLLPDAAPDAMRDPEALWSAALESEMTTDRKTGERRFQGRRADRVACGAGGAARADDGGSRSR